MSPRIHGTGPGAVGAAGGTAGGTEGVTGVPDCCPNIVVAVADAAIIALTKSRRRMPVGSCNKTCEIPVHYPESTRILAYKELDTHYLWIGFGNQNPSD
jgi:hypothetical protein